MNHSKWTHARRMKIYTLLHAEYCIFMGLPHLLSFPSQIENHELLITVSSAWKIHMKVKIGRNKNDETWISFTFFSCYQCESFLSCCCHSFDRSFFGSCFFSFCAFMICIPLCMLALIIMKMRACSFSRFFHVNWMLYSYLNFELQTKLPVKNVF